MRLYTIGKAIYLTARFHVLGSKNKRMFAQFQTANFFNLVHG